MHKFKFSCGSWCVTKIIAAIILAYPISGLTMAIGGLMGNLSWAAYHPLGAFAVTIIGAIWFCVAIPMSGGFPISDESGVHRINAYPYIIPTAVILAFIFFRGWRWFGLCVRKNHE